MADANTKVAQHPSRYVWDFWYSWDRQHEIFHVLYLNADHAIAASNQHHFASELGYAVTKDFVEIEWVNEERVAKSDNPLSLRDGETLLTAAAMRFLPDKKRLLLFNGSGVFRVSEYVD